MTPLLELHRHKGTLLFARKLLTAAFVLQLPFLIMLVLRQTDVLFHLDILGTRQLPSGVSWFLGLSSAAAAIIGFTIVCRQLSLWEGNLVDTEFAQRTRLLGSVKIAMGIQFFFYLVFLVPIFNLIPVAWARSQATTAIRDLELMVPARRR